MTLLHSLQRTKFDFLFWTYIANRILLFGAESLIYFTIHFANRTLLFRAESLIYFTKHLANRTYTSRVTSTLPIGLSYEQRICDYCLWASADWQSLTITILVFHLSHKNRVKSKVLKTLSAVCTYMAYRVRYTKIHSHFHGGSCLLRSDKVKLFWLWRVLGFRGIEKPLVPNLSIISFYLLPSFKYSTAENLLAILYLTVVIDTNRLYIYIRRIRLNKNTSPLNSQMIVGGGDQ